MSIKQAAEFLKKVGYRKKVSKFEKHREDILHLCAEGASLEIITKYLETKGVNRTKGYTALASYIRRHLADELVNKKLGVSAGNTGHKRDVFSGVSVENTSEASHSRRFVSSPSTRDKRANYDLDSKK
jgi:hypothetical protein